MFSLLKLLVCVVGLAGFVWWGVTVPLGSRTFFGHVYAIGQSRESQELVKGTKDKVGGVKRRIKTAEQGLEALPSNETEVPQTAPPQEKLTKADQQQMRKLIESGGASARR